MDEREAWMAQNTERLDQLEAEVLALAGIDEDHKDDPRYQLSLSAPFQ